MPTESRMLESELLYRVQQRIHDGRLPAQTPPSVSAGYAAGTEDCAVCDQRIAEGQVAYEVTDPHPLTFHRGCYMVWEGECAQRIADAERGRRKAQPHTQQADARNDTDSPERLFKA